MLLNILMPCINNFEILDAFFAAPKIFEYLLEHTLANFKILPHFLIIFISVGTLLGWLKGQPSRGEQRNRH